jgi:hypothetical protein
MPYPPRIDQMKRELGELGIKVLKMTAEELPTEEVDEKTLKDLEKRFEDYKTPELS